jgi:hypothetical protein
MISKRCSIITLLLLLLVSADGLADDWPQWMGPQRDNIWREAGIIDRFPSGGAKVLWRTKVAGGFAGPAVANGRVYVTDLVTADNVKVDNFDRNQFNGVERVLCLDAHTGEEIWTHELPVKYTMSYPAGPRCTPNVDGIQTSVLTQHPDAIFCAVETTGDGAVNFQSRVQIFLFKARQKARSEFDSALEECGLSLENAKNRSQRRKSTATD